MSLTASSDAMENAKATEAAEDAEERLAREWRHFADEVLACKPLDALVSKKPGAMSKSDLKPRMQRQIADLKESYLEYLAKQPLEDLSDDRLRSLERYTSGLPLKDYEMALDLVPELVNLVSLADALPLDGSGLPFDLKKIAIRCRGAVYFAPRRFTAVQLPFDEPRSRVLLFRESCLAAHTPKPQLTYSAVSHS